MERGQEAGNDSCNVHLVVAVTSRRPDEMGVFICPIGKLALSQATAWRLEYTTHADAIW